MLAGQTLQALNGRPQSFTFNSAISLAVVCQSQEELDALWDNLLAGGGKESQCGWLEDRFGLSWQVIPTALGEMLHDRDPAKAKRVVEAMMQMDKIDIRRLRQAYDGR